jgi:hypothetical protein
LCTLNYYELNTVVSVQAEEDAVEALESASADEITATELLPTISLSERSVGYYTERLRLARVQLDLEAQFGATFFRQQVQ